MDLPRQLSHLMFDIIVDTYFRLIMAFSLSLDQAFIVPLLSTYGKAALISRDGEEVKVPLAHLLGASPLVRSIVAESYLHPGIHGPLVLSFPVATDILGSGYGRVDC